MVSASHYIFMDLLNLHNSNRGCLREVCGIYGSRYSDDEEFQEINNLVLSAINNRDDDALGGLETKLREMIAARKTKVGDPRYAIGGL